MADCWRNSRARWMQGGINHQESKQHCACSCQCTHIFEKLEHRLKGDENRTKSSSSEAVNVEEILKDQQAEVSLQQKVRRRPTMQFDEKVDSSHCLCTHCCLCEHFSEEASSLRQQAIPQVSLMYNPPTFLQDLCGLASCTSSIRCVRVSEEECICHELWSDFFFEIMNAYVERYTDNVRDVNLISNYVKAIFHQISIILRRFIENDLYQIFHFSLFTSSLYATFFNI